MKYIFYPFFLMILTIALNTSIAQENNKYFRLPQSNYTIEQYLNIKAANSPSFSPDSKSIAYLSNTSGTMQIWIVTIDSNETLQLTHYNDNISFVRWLSDGSLLFGKAKDGDENIQFYSMKADGTQVRALTTDPSVKNNFGMLYANDKFIAYSSNKRHRQFFDIYSMEIATARETLIYQSNGYNELAAVNDNGSQFIISRLSDEFSLDNDLYLIELGNTQEYHLTPHQGPAEFRDVKFITDGIIMTHNDRQEFKRLTKLKINKTEPNNWKGTMPDNQKWDISDITINANGHKIAYIVNRDGYSDLYISEVLNDKSKVEFIKLPKPGIISGLEYSKDETKLAFAYSTSTEPSDIWIYDLKLRTLTKLTYSDTANIDPATFVKPKLIRFKTFDGRKIPAWYYKPSNINLKATDRSKIPVIVSVHGGPESQERPQFNVLYQYYLSRGYAILATNVRGSTGYGKTYTHLDDVYQREDAVKDLKFAVNWLKTFGNADPKRIAVMGQSYGGYMTLAAITLYPELWTAAIDTVGISNWESFLQNTSSYRRRQREVEYGQLDKDIEFLRSISPISKIDRIQSPLFVIAGRNDPRVPWTEGQQMVDALKARGVACEWKIYEDEGHGVTKLKNRMDLYPLVADFLDKYMKS